MESEEYNPKAFRSVEFITEVFEHYKSVHPEATGCQHSYEFITCCLNCNEIFSSWDVIKGSDDPDFKTYIDINELTNFQGSIPSHFIQFDFDKIEEHIHRNLETKDIVVLALKILVSIFS